MSCPACAEALKDKHAVLVLANCHACVVRSVSRAPEAIRKRFYERQDPKDRDLWMEEVGDEYARWRDMP